MFLCAFMCAEIYKVVQKPLENAPKKHNIIIIIIIILINNITSRTPAAYNLL